MLGESPMVEGVRAKPAGRFDMGFVAYFWFQMLIVKSDSKQVSVQGRKDPSDVIVQRESIDTPSHDESTYTTNRVLKKNQHNDLEVSHLSCEIE